MSLSVLTVNLNPAIDDLIRVENFAAGKDYRIRAAHATAGGKAINVSRTLQCFGVKSLITGLIGGTNGKKLQWLLDRESLPHAFFPADGETRTNITIFDLKNHATTRLIEPGPVVSAKTSVLFTSKLSQLLVRCSWVVCSGSLPPGIADGFYATLLRRARKAGRLTAVDTSGPALVASVRAFPDLLKINQRETEFLLGHKLSSLKAIKEAATQLRSFVGWAVIISLAAQGAVGFDGKTIIWAMPPELKRHSPAVGCGDALLGAFIAASMEKQSFAEALRQGVAAGSASILGTLPGFFRRKDFQRISAKVQLKLL